MIVDENLLKGNYATSFVTSILSQRCLVRPVAEGTDIGIDLYCESVNENEPFLHFWVQVKAISREQFSTETGEAYYDFDTRHLKYWENQPIPVYVFLVPLEKWPPVPPPTRAYGIRVTHNIAREGIPDQKYKRIKTREYLGIEDLQFDLDKFLSDVVPFDVSIQLLNRGVLTDIPSSKPILDNERQLPTFVALRYVDRILKNLLDTSVIAGFDTLAAGRFQPQMIPRRKLFQSIIHLFRVSTPILSPFAFSFLVRAAHEDGDTNAALALIDDYIKRINALETLSDEERADRIAGAKRLLLDFEHSPDTL